MDVLIGWSKDRSKAAAHLLHQWLPKLLPGIRPWISTIDIDKGSVWHEELSRFLGQARAVVIVLTSENVRSPWLYWEGGHVASHSGGLVCPFLLDGNRSLIADGPLSHRQVTVAEEADMLVLAKSFNRLLGVPFGDSEVEANFKREWTALSAGLKAIQQSESKHEAASFVQTEVDAIAGMSLSPEARMILMELGRDSHGSMLRQDGPITQVFQVCGRDLNAEESPRLAAKLKTALRSLEMHGLVERNGRYFVLTDPGYVAFEYLDEKLRDG